MSEATLFERLGGEDRVQELVTRFYDHMEQDPEAKAILDKHPGIFMPETKEPEFFARDDIYEKGIGYYADLFAEAGVHADYLALDEQTRIDVLTAELSTPRPLRHPSAEYTELTAKEMDVLDAAAQAVKSAKAEMPRYFMNEVLLKRRVRSIRQTHFEVAQLAPSLFIKEFGQLLRHRPTELLHIHDCDRAGVPAGDIVADTDRDELHRRDFLDPVDHFAQMRLKIARAVHAER